MAFLRLSDIWLTSKARAPQALFAGLSLGIHPGEIFALIGPSGEGKTVLLKMMAGLVPPERGEVLLEAEPIYGRRRGKLAEKVGMAFQKGGLFDYMTVGENLRFPLREVRRLDARAIDDAVTRSLNDVGLGGQEALDIAELSGGMQKRLGLARTLVLSPRLALFDEPTAGLDPITSRSILDLIAAVRKKYDMTVVLVTSDPASVSGMADRMGFLYRGALREVGPVGALRESRDPAVRQFLEGSLDGPLTKEAEAAWASREGETR